MGDSLILTGNHPSLGNWDPHRGIRMTTSPSEFPRWRMDPFLLLMISKAGQMEFKFVIEQKQGGGFKWEPFLGNRTFGLSRGVAFFGRFSWADPNLQGSESKFVSLAYLLTHANSKEYITLKEEFDDILSRQLDQLRLNAFIRRYQKQLFKIEPPFDPFEPHDLAGFTADELRLLLAEQNVTTDLTLIGNEAFVEYHPHRRNSRGIEEPQSSPVSVEELFPNLPSESELEKPLSQRVGKSVSGDSRHVKRRLRKETLILDHFVPIQSRYRFGRLLGRGAWGEVREIVDIETGARRAAKRIPKCYVEDYERFKAEIELMKALDHPNIIRVYETYEDLTDVYLVMELCEGGELFDRLTNRGTLSEEEARIILKQILLAVAYCHTMNVAHRDLKPENFLFVNPYPDMTLKVIDFGLAERFSPGVPMRTKAGTLYYVAPQVLEGQYGPECDIWSVGVVLFIMLCGYPPFDAATDRGVMQKVLVGQYLLPDDPLTRQPNQTTEDEDDTCFKLSDEAKDLLAGMLRRHQKLRLTAEQALAHPFFKSNAPRKPFRPSFDIVAKFRRFQELSRMKKIALTVVAQHLGEADCEALRQAFMELNTTNDGLLTPDQIREGIEKAAVALPVDMYSVIESVNTSGRGRIAYSEFLAACLKQSHYIQEEACRAAFRVFDTQNRGYISLRELRQVLSKAQVDSSLDLSVEILESEFGSDKVYLTFEDFFQFMRKIPSQALLGYSLDEAMLMMTRISSRRQNRESDSEEKEHNEI